MHASGIGFTINFGIGDLFEPERPPARVSYAQACAHDEKPKRSRSPKCPVHDRGFYHSADVYEDERGVIWRRRVPSPPAKPAPKAQPQQPKAEQASKPQPINKMTSSWVTLPDLPDDAQGSKTPELSSSPGTTASTSGSPKQKSSAKF